MTRLLRLRGGRRPAANRAWAPLAARCAERCTAAHAWSPEWRCSADTHHHESVKKQLLLSSLSRHAYTGSEGALQGLEEHLTPANFRVYNNPAALHAHSNDA